MVACYYAHEYYEIVDVVRIWCHRKDSNILCVHYGIVELLSYQCDE